MNEKENEMKSFVQEEFKDLTKEGLINKLLASYILLDHSTEILWKLGVVNEFLEKVRETPILYSEFKQITSFFSGVNTIKGSLVKEGG